MNKLIGLLIISSLISCKQKTDSTYQVPIKKNDGLIVSTPEDNSLLKQKSGCTYQAPVDKNDGLKVSTLENHGLDIDIFQKVNKDICSGMFGNLHSVLVIHNNELVVEQYYNGWNENQIHFLASTTKSFSAIMTGIAIEKGKIKDENEKMLSFFPTYLSQSNDELKEKITIKHLLTNTSGFKWDEVSLPVDDPKNMGYQMDKMDNLLKASIELPMETTPGTKYTYSGPNNIILGEIIKAATGQNIADFTETNLFEPLGISDYHWFSKNGIYDVGGGLKLKSRDIAKFGLLHLNKGQWNGKQIVSSEWMDEIFEPYIEIKHPLYSCCQWQMVKTEYGFNSWFISGYGGQIINVVPDLNMVIVINADNRENPKEKRKPLEFLIKDLTAIHPKLRN